MAEVKGLIESQPSTTSLDELQEETSKLMCLLEDRQMGQISWNMLLRGQIESVHDLTTRALGK